MSNVIKVGFNVGAEVVKGKERRGGTLYYSDQLILLAEQELESGEVLVINRFTDSILVIQKYSADYVEFLSEQEVIITSDMSDEVACISCLNLLAA